MICAPDVAWCRQPTDGYDRNLGVDARPILQHLKLFIVALILIKLHIYYHIFKQTIANIISMCQNIIIKLIYNCFRKLEVILVPHQKNMAGIV